MLFEPADKHKASKVLMADTHEATVYATPNLNELRMMAAYLTGSPDVDSGKYAVCEIIQFHGHKISWFDTNGHVCGH